MEGTLFAPSTKVEGEVSGVDTFVRLIDRLLVDNHASVHALYHANSISSDDSIQITTRPASLPRRHPSPIATALRSAQEVLMDTPRER